MDAVLLILVCVGAGLFLRRVPQRDAAATGLNHYVISVAVPALVLKAVPALRPDPSLLAAGLLPWLAFGLSALVWSLLARPLRLEPATRWSLVLVTGLGNTAFVGYPVVEALMGAPGLEVAVVVDQAGSFLVFATVGVWVAQLGSGGGTQATAIFRRVLAFPPFGALLLALILPRFGVGRWVLDELGPTLDVLASTVSPVALVTVGMRVRLQADALRDPLVGAVLGVRMVLTPLLAWALLAGLGVEPLVLRVTVIQLGMPPMVTAALLAADRGLDPDRAMRAVALGLPVTLVTVPILFAWLSPG